ncbi:hypothetical protein LCGC14_0724350, partial [marine sediment metagenome]
PDIVVNLIRLFEGKIERVPGFTSANVSLDVVRNEIADDRLLGRLVTLADFPDAPPEVLGATIPLVFGQVDLSRAVIINTNAVDRLFFNHFIADQFIKLRDVSEFPTAGTIQVGDEQVAYTGKDATANELTGATRGANGTIASDHAKDTVVRELGPFVAKFADHPVDQIIDIRIRDSQGNLGEPVPDPTSIDHDLATATWDELPRVRSSGVESLFQRIHFRDQEASNRALNAKFAARENPAYGTFDFADVTPGNPLKITTNTENLGEPGDIKRAWIAVVHDSTPTSNQAEEIDDGSGFVQRPDEEVAQERVEQQIFDFVPLPEGGFINATRVGEAVRDDIRDNGTDPAVATFNQMTASRQGVPNGYDTQFSANVASLVTQDVAAEQALGAAHDKAVADANAAAQAATRAAIATGSTVTFPSKSPTSFSLVAEDLTPIEIARFDDRTNDRLYDVEVQIVPFVPETKTLVPQVRIEAAGVWSNAPKVLDHELLVTTRENAESIFDGERDRTGDAAFNIPGEINAGDGPGFAARVKFLEGQVEPQETGFKIKRARIRVFVDTVTVLGFIYAPMLAYLEDRSGKISGSEVNCRLFNIPAGGTEATIPTGCIVAPAEFFSEDIDIEVFGSRLQLLDNLRMVLEPSAPTDDGDITCLNFWVCMTCDLIIELEKEPPPEPVIEDRKGITNHFEMTEFVDGDWNFFNDPERGGSITIESAIGGLRVLEAYWVVEYQPFFDVSSSVPDIFANVTGRVPGGNPADISEAIVTSAPPLGMGLPSTSIAREDYTPARGEFAADGIRADFTITEQVNAVEVLTRLAEQCDFRQAWSRGRHRIVRKPVVGGMLRVDGVLKLVAGDVFTAVRDLSDADVFRDTLGFSRSALEEIRTRASVKFKPLTRAGEFGGSLEIISDAAEVEFGRREGGRNTDGRTRVFHELDLIRDAATAELVSSRDLLRHSTPRWFAEMLLPLFGLELKLGDLVSLDHREFSFAFGEVLDASVETVSLDNGPSITVNVALIVWEK